MRPDAEAGQEQQDRVIPQGLGIAACTGGDAVSDINMYPEHTPGMKPTVLDQRNLSD
jgi:hypothetical protein